MLRLREVLQEKGMTNKELAAEMEVSPQYVSSIIRETGSVSLEVLSNIAKILEVPLASLFDDYPKRTVRCPECGKELEIEIRLRPKE